MQPSLSFGSARATWTDMAPSSLSWPFRGGNRQPNRRNKQPSEPASQAPVLGGGAGGAGSWLWRGPPLGTVGRAQTNRGRRRSDWGLTVNTVICAQKQASAFNPGLSASRLCSQSNQAGNGGEAEALCGNAPKTLPASRKRRVLVLPQPAALDGFLAELTATLATTKC